MKQKIGSEKASVIFNRDNLYSLLAILTTDGNTTIPDLVDANGAVLQTSKGKG